jgi:hypothetical protein
VITVTTKGITKIPIIPTTLTAQTRGKLKEVVTIRITRTITTAQIPENPREMAKSDRYPVINSQIPYLYALIRG